MNTRVIDDPSAGGWELDPDTGRWMWAGTGSGGGSLDYTLPVALRTGDVQLPLTVDGAKLAVMTRSGELELPLAA